MSRTAAKKLNILFIALPSIFGHNFTHLMCCLTLQNLGGGLLVASQEGASRSNSANAAQAQRPGLVTHACFIASICLG